MDEKRREEADIRERDIAEGWVPPSEAPDNFTSKEDEETKDPDRTKYHH